MRGWCGRITDDRTYRTYRRDKKRNKNFFGREIARAKHFRELYTTRTENARGSVAAEVVLFRNSLTMKSHARRIVPAWKFRRAISRQPRVWFVRDGRGEAHGSFLKEQAKIKHACINRECQSPLRRGWEGDDVAFISSPLISEVRVLCDAFLWTFMRKYLGVIWETLELNIYA